MRVLCASLLLSLGLIASAHSQQTTQPVDPTTAQAKELDHYRKVANDYGQLSRYAAANASLPPATAADKRVIFYGDSITDGWHLDQFFPDKGYVNRGISGQTTPQMLVRFRQDVIDLHPAVLVVLAGTNDLSGNTGPETTEQIEGNFANMTELAQAHGIRMVLASVTPVSSYGTAGASMLIGRPPAKIVELNKWLQQYCATNHLTYLDYYPALLDANGMLKREYSADGLHPNAAGYAVMAPPAQAAVNRALASR